MSPEIKYWDKEGREIPNDEWFRLWRDQQYRQVALDRLGHAAVSTIWLGVNHGNPLGERPHHIFETAVDPEAGAGVDVTDRYNTLEEALAGHAKVVARVRLHVCS